MWQQGFKHAAVMEGFNNDEQALNAAASTHVFCQLCSA
jgi:hypothetical protein